MNLRIGNYVVDASMVVISIISYRTDISRALNQSTRSTFRSMRGTTMFGRFWLCIITGFQSSHCWFDWFHHANLLVAWNLMFVGLSMFVVFVMYDMYNVPSQFGQSSDHRRWPLPCCLTGAWWYGWVSSPELTWRYNRWEANKPIRPDKGSIQQVFFFGGGIGYMYI